ncbi:NAD+ synthase [Campylobacter estrildidarum]|uniref:NH(3)-dependent NAD(+) synthetase n=1 Tax=Campylobacter estrildidarum TaxID=2510189 RepID=A0A4U7BI49_9BACT|nr:NAD+ synthase [Campylobacter estrildidarum]TKX30001.1 NAD(+) synthetase [Campylobacter estrildidarum]
MQCELIFKNLCAFIKEQIQKNKKNGVVLGLSGGIDSALVATLCKKALNENVFALLMPTQFSSKEHLNDALMLCNDLKIEYKIISIQKILDAFIEQSEDIDKIRIGNYAARIRMSLLYDYSMMKNSLVVGTSNKSELLLGYGTIYGDLACAFNPIGELYKTQVYKLAKFLNLHENFIKKIPSADLWENQSDEKDLGFTYEQIDVGLKAIERDDRQVMEQLDKKLLDMLKSRIANNAFKRSMPKIANLMDFKSE